MEIEIEIEIEREREREIRIQRNYIKNQENEEVEYKFTSTYVLTSSFPSNSISSASTKIMLFCSNR